MTINEKIITTLTPLNILITTLENAPKNKNSYVVIIPLTDTLDGYADNKPTAEICQVELAIYNKGNYISLVNEITKLLVNADFTITSKKYIEYENDTKFHHYAIGLELEQKVDF